MADVERQKSTPGKLALQVLAVAGTSVGWAAVNMLLAAQLWPHYRAWAHLEPSVDDAGFAVGALFLGLIQGAVMGIWAARKINDEPLNQKRARD